MALMLAMLAASAAAAAPTVARVTLDLPASGGEAARSIEIQRFTLDAQTDFTLLRHAKTSPSAHSRIVVQFVSPPEDATFALHGGRSHFAWVAIRQADASGATLRRSLLDGVRVVRIERITSDAGVSRRVTFAAGRVHELPVGPPH